MSVGTGGMGEVYRARDTRLDRDVAIKVSATEFPERFAREARSIAALNHANVCHLYDVGPNYLVLEFVEGESPSGPMPFDEAMPIIRQLIDGIEAAHEKNIIHRDLKPANIRITPDGVVKILDFGLAKAAEPESAIVDVADSPTLTRGLTQAGAILGTAAYMAPEQARGKTADRRSDIWSFGAVVYELLVGRNPFEGESVADILGNVINREPDWSRVPPRALRLLRCCLQKDRRNRLAAISDARLLLEQDDAVAARAVATTTRRLVWPAAAAGLLLLGAVSAYGWWRATRLLERPMARLSVDLGPRAVRGSGLTAVLSPDGTRLVFTGRADADGLTQLYTRMLDQPDATAIPWTAYGSLTTPFFSPDGDWIGYFGNGRLMKVAVQGGAPMEVGSVLLPRTLGAAWGEDGNIIVGSMIGLMQVSSSDGAPTSLGETPVPGAFPHILPGGRGVLFNTAGQFGGDLDELDIEVLDLSTRQKKLLVKGGFWPRYAPTSPKTGHLLFIRNETLFGVGFDPGRLEIRGSPVPLVDNVSAAISAAGGGGQFTFSDTGTLVFLAGAPENRVYPVQWLDADGGTTPLVAQAGAFITPRLAPDGRRLAYNMSTPRGLNTWIYDIARDTPTQLTFNGSAAFELAWSPDSKHVVYGDGTALWWISADGAGQPFKLLDGMINPRAGSFAPDGRLAFSSASSTATPDVWTLPLDLSDPDRPKPGKPEPFLTDPRIAEVDPAFSPDGKFIAYASSESGREEIFVRPFPGPGGKWKVSAAGGKFPAWSRSTRELFFLAGGDYIEVVPYTVLGNSFIADKGRRWSPTTIRRDGVRQSFDISADGKRAVVLPRPTAEQAPGNLHVTFLLNFFDEVRRRIPGP